MFVSRLEVQGFKSFSGRHEFRFAPGLNLLVGDNNSGKSSVLEALQFLRDGTNAANPLADVINHLTNETVTVTIDLRDCAARVADDARLAKFKEFLFKDSDGRTILRLQRSSAEREVTQGNKAKRLSVKEITVWNDTSAQYENPTGIDAPVKALIDFEPVWADLSPDDAANFATNKTLGRLARLALGELASSDEWSVYEKAHKTAFMDGDKSVVALTNSLAVDISGLVSDQYGDTIVSFEFPSPDPDSLIKNGVLMVDDGDVKMSLAQKGTGLRRAVSLALIQLYAKSRASANEDRTGTPVILMIDEPETWLHPRAQLKLIEALATLLDDEQVFIATHSPYLLRGYRHGRDRLVVLRQFGDNPRVRHDETMGLLTSAEPSWGEINFHAFDLASHEFHNELFSMIHVHHSPDEERPLRLTDLDDRMVEAHDLERTATWQPVGRQSYACTLPHAVRNAHHHPENPRAREISEKDLEASIRLLHEIAVRLPKETVEE